MEGLKIKECVAEYNKRNARAIKSGQLARMTCSKLAVELFANKDYKNSTRKHIIWAWQHGKRKCPAFYLKGMAEVLGVSMRQLTGQEPVELVFSYDKFRELMEATYREGLKDGGLQDEEIGEKFVTIQFKNFRRLAPFRLKNCIENSSEPVKVKCL